MKTGSGVWESLSWRHAASMSALEKGAAKKNGVSECWSPRLGDMLTACQPAA
jgi:hypothetical protein